MTKLLVISHKTDPHIPFLQKHLDEEVIIFDPAQFPFNTDITYIFNDKNFDIYSSGVHFNNLDAVWYRKPIYLKPENFDVQAEYKEFTYKAYEATVKALYDLLRNKLWVSDVGSIKKASNKLFQLEVARDLEFAIPPTLITSNSKHASDFRNVHGRIVTKSLVFHPVTKDDGETYIFYTTSIPSETEIDFSGLCMAPALFQAEIQKVADIRVTVVDQEVFPCRISSIGSMKSEVDWRVGILGNELRYKVDSEFPKHLKDRCVQLVQILGLKFGAIDFVQDLNGKYWFLEINPNGQWGFVEEETGLPIAASLAKLFQKSHINT